MREYINSIKGKKFKKILISVLALILIIASTIAICLLSGDMRSSDFGVSKKVEYTGGTATSGQTYTISSEASLRALAYFVNGGQNMAGVTFELTKDIDLNPGITFKADGTYTGGIPIPWTAIGGYTSDTVKPFSGTFDGKGFEIKGLYINKTGTTVNDSYQGLFGYVNNATIKNVGITSGYVKGNYYLGGIIGTATLSQLKDCYNIACVVGGTGYSGALVGCLSNSTVTKCYNTALVSGGDSCIGGIVGDAREAVRVENCYNSGTINGRSFTGGIVGYTRGQSTVANCYNTGDVQGTNTNGTAINTGGITGVTENSTVENCYNAGSVKGATSLGGLVGGTGGAYAIKNSYWLTGKSSVAIGNGTGTNVISFTATNGGTLASSVTVNGTATTSLLTALNAGLPNNTANPWTIESGVNNGYPVLVEKFPTDNGNWIDDRDTTWDGNTITNARELAQFAYNVNNGNTYAGQTITLGNDIDLSGKQWTAIGSYISDTVNKPFSGIFDGKGFEIKGLYINKTGTTAADDYQGLFGYVNNGTVKNVSIVDGYIKGYNNIGGIAGHSDTSNILNCYNTGFVSGHYTLSGIVGWSLSSTITNCYNTGSISGDASVGSVAGVATSSIVLNCYNTGTVIGNSQVGGVVGLTNSSTVENCYNIGTVTGSSYVGGVVGRVRLSTTVKNSYWLTGTAANGIGINESSTVTNIISFTATNGGTLASSVTVNGTATTSLLTALNAGIGTASKPWAIENGVNNGYPVLVEKFPTDNGNWIVDRDTTWNGNTITNARELAQFAYNVNNGITYAGQTITLANDIDLSGKQWTAIGSQLKPFSGIFDGAGYVIKGIYINKTGTTGADNFQGLFGYLSGATIKNVGVVGGYIRGNNCVGGVVGRADNSSKIENCYNTGSIIGNNYVGGVVGEIYNYTTITNCYNTGTVSGYVSRVGGVVGLAQNYSTIINCYNTGSISSSVSHVGGVVGGADSSTVTNCYNTGTVKCSGIYVSGVAGRVYSSTTVSNCYNTGTINGNSYVGGVVGHTDTSATITNCYNTATISGTDSVGGVVGYTDTSATITNCYWLNTSATKGIGSGSGTNIVAFTSSNGGTLSSSVTVNGTATTSLLGALNAGVGASATMVPWAIKGGVNNGYPVLVEEFPTDSGNWIDDRDTTWDGDTITNAREFAQFAYNVNNGNTYAGRTITLANNIDLSGKQWTAIGSQAKPFSGTFDGAGYEIKGVYINKTGITAADSYQGLFGCVNKGTVKNVGMVDGYIRGYNHVGGMVGYAENLTVVENCYNTGTVIGNDVVGGVVGYAYSSTVKNCYSTGSVSGVTNVGGVAGYALSSTVTNCYNTGTVSGNGLQVAGVVGGTNSSTVENCYNTGSVSGNDYVGGVAGWANTSTIITNCYNTGSVNGKNQVGGVVGYATSSTVTNCYNTGVVNGTGNNVGGVVGYAKTSTLTNCYNTGSVTGSNNIGGVAGYAEKSTVENCYNTGTVSGKEAVGGVVGYAYDSSKIENCYNTGSVNGNKYIGGVVGVADNSAIIKNCYWLTGTATTGVGLNYNSTSTVTNVISFTATNGGTLASSVTVNGTATTSLLTALNAGVGASSTMVPWAIGNGVNYGFPVLVEEFPTDNGNWLDGISIVTDTWDNGGVIYTAEELSQFSYNVNNGKTYSGQTITLGNNIDLSGKQWTAIGSQEKPFSGIFDGAGFEVKGIYINKTGTTAADGYQGLFGCVNKGTVKNVGIVDGYIRGYNHVGGVVGYAENYTVVENCYNTGTVNGNEMVGGVVGYIRIFTKITNCYNTGTVNGNTFVGGAVGKADSSTIENCYNTGSVTGSVGSVGGVVGYAQTSTVVENCYNTGTVSGTKSVGGVVGQMDRSAIVQNCYNNGSVRGNTHVGGVVGSLNNSSIVQDCYNTGTVSATSYVGGIAGNIYYAVVKNSYNAGMIKGTNDIGGISGYIHYSTVENCYNIGVVNGTTNIGGVIGSVNDVSTITNCYWLTGTATLGIGTGTGTITNVVSFTASNGGTLASSVTVNGIATTNLLTALNAGLTNNTNKPWAIKNGVNYGFPVFLDEFPTDNGNWLDGISIVTDTWDNGGVIYTAEELSQFSYNVNNGKTYSGQTITLGNDIDLSGKQWTAIGNNTKFFSGIFDGKGFEVKGIYINKTGTTGADNFQGLFGCVYGATIKNVGVVDGYIRGYHNIGSVVGYAGDSTKIENCYNTAVVNGSGNSVGGVAGYALNATITDCCNTGTVSGAGNNTGGVVGTHNTSTITNCYNAGTINGNNYVGGMVGYATSSTVENCYNTGYITGSHNIGGVVGYANISTVESCYNTGTVIGATNNIGGVVGQAHNFSKIENCYNTGSIIGNSYVGGVVGQAYDSSKIENCYNTCSVNGNNYVGGVVGYAYNASTILNCYNTGSVNGNSQVGGVVGHAISSTTITNCYNTGTISGTKSVGGVVGHTDTSTTVTSCYWLNGTATLGIGTAGGTVTNVISFTATNGGMFTASIAINGTTTNSLLVALNAGRSGSMVKWGKVADINNGYPIFAKFSAPVITSNNGIVNSGNHTITYGDYTTIDFIAEEGAIRTEYSWDNANWLVYSATINAPKLGSGSIAFYTRSVDTDGTFSEVDSWTFVEKTATDLTTDKVSFMGVKEINGENHYQRNKFSITITRPENAINLKYMLYVDGSRPAEWKTLSFLSEDGNTINTTITLPFDNSIPHRSTIKIELQVGNSETYSDTILTYVFKEGSPEIPQTVSSNAYGTGGNLYYIAGATSFEFGMPEGANKIFYRIDGDKDADDGYTQITADGNGKYFVSIDINNLGKLNIQLHVKAKNEAGLYSDALTYTLLEIVEVNSINNSNDWNMLVAGANVDGNEVNSSGANYGNSGLGYYNGKQVTINSDITLHPDTLTIKDFRGTIIGNNENVAVRTISGINKSLINQLRNATVIGIQVNGTVTSSAVGAFRGGLADNITNSKIINVGTNVNINAGSGYAGGIAGSIDKDTHIINSYAIGALNADKANGLVGVLQTGATADVNIENCHYKGTFIGKTVSTSDNVANKLNQNVLELRKANTSISSQIKFWVTVDGNIIFTNDDKTPDYDGAGTAVGLIYNEQQVLKIGEKTYFYGTLAIGFGAHDLLLAFSHYEYRIKVGDAWTEWTKYTAPIEIINSTEIEVRAVSEYFGTTNTAQSSPVKKVMFVPDNEAPNTPEVFSTFAVYRVGNWETSSIKPEDRGLAAYNTKAHVIVENKDNAYALLDGSGVGISHFQYRINGSYWIRIEVIDGRPSLLEVEAIDGAYSIEIRAVDRFGHVGASETHIATINVIIDTTAPETPIVAPDYIGSWGSVIHEEGCSGDMNCVCNVIGVTIRFLNPNDSNLRYEYKILSQYGFELPNIKLEDHGNYIIIKEPGVFKIYVTAFDLAGNKSKAARDPSIIKIDDGSPNIEVKGNPAESDGYVNSIQLLANVTSKNEPFDIGGIVVGWSDGGTEDEALNSTVSWNDKRVYDVDKNGFYIVWAKDILGNLSKKVVKVTKYNSGKPTAPTMVAEVLMVSTDGANFEPFKQTSDIFAAGDGTTYIPVADMALYPDAAYYYKWEQVIENAVAGLVRITMKHGKSLGMVDDEGNLIPGSQIEIAMSQYAIRKKTDNTDLVWKQVPYAGNENGIVFYLEDANALFDGNYNIHGVTCDSTGNLSGESASYTRILTLTIDNVVPFAPKVTVLPDNSKNVAGKNIFVNNDKFTVIASQVDEVSGSGIDRIEYKKSDDAVWTKYNGALDIDSTGSAQVTYLFRQVDKVGNVSENYELSLVIDKDAPIIGADDVDYKEASSEAIDFKVRVNDGAITSGIDIVQYSLDNVMWKTATYYQNEYLFTINAYGQNTVYIRAKDFAGNISSVVSRDIIISADKPSVTVNVEEGWKKAESADTTKQVDFKFGGSLGVSHYQIATTTTAVAGNWLELTSGIDTITQNLTEGTYYVHAKNLVGNTCYVEFIVDKFDGLAPVITDVIVSEKWHNGSKDIAVNAVEEGSGIEGYFATTDSAYTPTAADFGAVAKVTDNGTYYIYAIDNVGNISASAFTFAESNIDKVKPTITLSDTVNGVPVLGMADDEFGSGIAGYYFSNKDYLQNTILQGNNEGVVDNPFMALISGYYWAVDKAGNISENNYKVDLVLNDTTAPTVANVVAPNQDQWTKDKRDLVITISDNKSIFGYAITTVGTAPSVDSSDWVTNPLIIGKMTANVTAKVSDGTYYIWARDMAGNISVKGQSYTISKVDLDAPIISNISMDNTAGGAVAVTITAEDYMIAGGINGINCSGLADDAYSMDGVIWQTSNIFELVDNGTFVFYVRDKVGNITTQSVVISNVDRDPPILSAMVADADRWTNVDKAVTLTFADAKSGVTHYIVSTVNSKPSANSSEWQAVPVGAMTLTLTFGSGTYYAWVKDGVGNISAGECTFTIAKIDYKVLDFMVEVTDMDGNVLSANPDTWIQKVNLRVLAMDGGNVDFGDSLGYNNGYTDMPYSFDGGVTWQESNMFVADKNGTYNILIRNNAGTTASAEIVVARIDDIAPTNNVKVVINVDNVQKPNSWHNKNKAINIKVADNESGAGQFAVMNSLGEAPIWSDYVPDTAPITESKGMYRNLSDTVSEDAGVTVSGKPMGVYYVVSKDKAGNVSAVQEVKVDQIERDAPKIEYSYQGVVIGSKENDDGEMVDVVGNKVMLTLDDNITIGTPFSGIAGYAWKKKTDVNWTTVNVDIDNPSTIGESYLEYNKGKLIVYLADANGAIQYLLDDYYDFKVFDRAGNSTSVIDIPLAAQRRASLIDEIGALPDNPVPFHRDLIENELGVNGKGPLVLAEDSLKAYMSIAQVGMDSIQNDLTEGGIDYFNKLMRVRLILDIMVSTLEETMGLSHTMINPNSGLTESYYGLQYYREQKDRYTDENFSRFWIDEQQLPYDQFDKDKFGNNTIYYQCQVDISEVNQGTIQLKDGKWVLTDYNKALYNVKKKAFDTMKAVPKATVITVKTFGGEIIKENGVDITVNNRAYIKGNAGGKLDLSKYIGEKNGYFFDCFVIRTGSNEFTKYMPEKDADGNYLFPQANTEIECMFVKNIASQNGWIGSELSTIKLINDNWKFNNPTEIINGTAGGDTYKITYTPNANNYALMTGDTYASREFDVTVNGINFELQTNAFASENITFTNANIHKEYTGTFSNEVVVNIEYYLETSLDDPNGVYMFPTAEDLKDKKFIPWTNAFNAGEYFIVAKFTGTLDNSVESKVGILSAMLTVEQAVLGTIAGGPQTPEKPTVGNVTLEKNLTLAQIVLPIITTGAGTEQDPTVEIGAWAWTDGTIAITALGEKTYSATYTPADANYAPYAVDLTFTVVAPDFAPMTIKEGHVGKYMVVNGLNKALTMEQREALMFGSQEYGTNTKPNGVFVRGVASQTLDIVLSQFNLNMEQLEVWSVNSAGTGATIVDPSNYGTYKARSGLELRIVINGEIKEVITLVVMGDSNNDGNVNTQDFAPLNNHLKERNIITEGIKFITYDFNYSGSINTQDFAPLNNHLKERKDIHADLLVSLLS